jgi:hypothetical protein
MIKKAVHRAVRGRFHHRHKNVPTLTANLQLIVVLCTLLVETYAEVNNLPSTRAIATQFAHLLTPST